MNKSSNFLHTKLGRELIEKVQKDQNFEPTIFEVNDIWNKIETNM